MQRQAATARRPELCRAQHDQEHIPTGPGYKCLFAGSRPSCPGGRLGHFLLHATVCVLLLALLHAAQFAGAVSEAAEGRGQTLQREATEARTGVNGEVKYGDQMHLPYVIKQTDGVADIAVAGQQLLPQRRLRRQRRKASPSSEQAHARQPPLELTVMPEEQRIQVTIPKRCVIIFGTGRSGSTSLQDAVNQLPNFLVRGEQWGSFYHLYQMWRTLQSSVKEAWKDATEIRIYEQAAEARYGERAVAWLTYESVKKMYDTLAVRKKLPWFNDFHPLRLIEAARSVYALTYGHHGPDIVSGFKEIRFCCGQSYFPDCRYEEFAEFVDFLRRLCVDVKVLLNSRATHTAEFSAKLGHMLINTNTANNVEQLDHDLKVTHEWYDRYAQEHPDAAFRVLVEDMYDRERNATLARRLLQFLGEDPDVHNISFARMPTWS